MTELEKAREIINETDARMAELFEKRMDAARLVAAYKKERGLPVDDIPREERLLKKNSALIKNDNYKPYYNDFLKGTILLSKSLQHRILDGMRVAFSGTAGAFAQMAAKSIFPDAATVAYPDFKAAYNAAVSGECDCALLPVENSFNGDVGKVMDLTFFGSLYINGIYEAEIIQNLLGTTDAHISDIKKVISHPQALGQCASYIESHGFSSEEAVNTALAAKSVADNGDKTVAAIGSADAADEFGLKILEPHINESGTNTTRFAVFSRADRTPTAHDDRFVMLFTVKNAAGSLGKAISVIGSHGFNLRALKSRPTKELVWSYYFYAEGEGNIATANGREMIKDLKKCCNTIKIAGSFDKEIRIKL